MSNSLKYAFPDELKADVAWVNAKSLGLRLVRRLAEQLGAALELHLTTGTEVHLAFAAAA